jgi:Tol biopolymer transport system component
MRRTSSNSLGKSGVRECGDTQAMLAALVALTLSPSHMGCACGAFLPAYDERGATMAQVGAPAAPDSAPIPPRADEPNLSNVRQLTFGGQNAEAYWSPDGKHLTYQTRQPGYPDEQIFTMRADGSGKRLVSTGKGRTTCSYFTPNQREIYFSSTHKLNEGPQAPIDMSKGYVWMVNPQFALYRARPDGSNLQPVLALDGYVAETTIAPNGKFMTFTSDFEGDLEIYRSDLNGKNIRRLTNEVGYDGGPFISWDSRRIVWRRDLIESPAEEADYKALLAQHLVRPSKLEIWIMDADGKNQRQVTKLGAASFAPFLHPNNKQIIFCSNYGDPRGREFDLFLIDVDGTNLRRVTHSPDFDGFPMISRDGKRLVWASNRNGKVRGETNVFVADWKDVAAGTL